MNPNEMIELEQISKIEKKTTFSHQGVFLVKNDLTLIFKRVGT